MSLILRHEHTPVVAPQEENFERESGLISETKMCVLRWGCCRRSQARMAAAAVAAALPALEERHMSHGTRHTSHSTTCANKVDVPRQQPLAQPIHLARNAVTQPQRHAVCQVITCTTMLDTSTAATATLSLNGRASKYASGWQGSKMASASHVTRSPSTDTIRRSRRGMQESDTTGTTRTPTAG